MKDTTGFKSPNYTQVPNDLLGLWADKDFQAGLLAEMSESELKVVLAVLRFTVGFHQTAMRCSLSNMMRATGLSKQGVLNGAAAAEQRGLIARGQDGGLTIWAVIVDGELILPDKIRAVSLKRRCPACGRKHNRLKTHHRTPTRLGGSDESSNKIELCENCHFKVHKLIDELEDPTESDCAQALALVLSGQSKWSILWTGCPPKKGSPPPSGQQSRPPSIKETLKESKESGDARACDSVEIDLAVGSTTVKCENCGETFPFAEIRTKSSTRCPRCQVPLLILIDGEPYGKPPRPKKDPSKRRILGNLLGEDCPVLIKDFPYFADDRKRLLRAWRGKNRGALTEALNWGHYKYLQGMPKHLAVKNALAFYQGLIDNIGEDLEPISIPIQAPPDLGTSAELPASLASAFEHSKTLIAKMEADEGGGILGER